MSIQTYRILSMLLARAPLTVPEIVALTDVSEATVYSFLHRRKDVLNSKAVAVSGTGKPARGGPRKSYQVKPTAREALLHELDTLFKALSGEPGGLFQEVREIDPYPLTLLSAEEQLRMLSTMQEPEAIAAMHRHIDRLLESAANAMQKTRYAGQADLKRRLASARAALQAEKDALSSGNRKPSKA